MLNFQLQMSVQAFICQVTFHITLLTVKNVAILKQEL